MNNNNNNNNDNTHTVKLLIGTVTIIGVEPLREFSRFI